MCSVDLGLDAAGRNRVSPPHFDDAPRHVQSTEPVVCDSWVSQQGTGTATAGRNQKLAYGGDDQAANFY